MIVYNKSDKKEIFIYTYQHSNAVISITYEDIITDRNIYVSTNINDIDITQKVKEEMKAIIILQIICDVLNHTADIERLDYIKNQVLQVVRGL